MTTHIDWDSYDPITRTYLSMTATSPSKEAEMKDLMTTALLEASRMRLDHQITERLAKVIRDGRYDELVARLMVRLVCAHSDVLSDMYPGE